MIFFGSICPVFHEESKYTTVHCTKLRKYPSLGAKGVKLRKKAGVLKISVWGWGNILFGWPLGYSQGENDSTFVVNSVNIISWFFRLSDILSKCKTSLASLLSRGSQTSSSSVSFILPPRIEITSASCDAPAGAGTRRHSRYGHYQVSKWVANS